MLLDLLEQQQEEEDTDPAEFVDITCSERSGISVCVHDWSEEELLPHKNSIAAETIEEERRLMYVGITVRVGLTLTLAEQRKNGGQMRQMTQAVSG